MVNWQTSDLIGFESRNAKRQAPTANPHDGLESELHDQIISYCKSKTWYYERCRMDVPSTVRKGAPDFKIACNGGVTLWCEVKRKGEKLTKEQSETIYWLKTLGHVAFAVWSMTDFHNNLPHS